MIPPQRKESDVRKGPPDFLGREAKRPLQNCISANYSTILPKNILSQNAHSIRGTSLAGPP
ncbi:MAG: hypothetical protein C4527_25220 [Candidatus Omnitrophota bacterium]|nr:MAG: hypothetical protein C4527_25220 [Candidatus Omnitrophota bacterium]